MLTQKLLDWYDRHRRVMPWRALPGVVADPYAVWLSEIMLQQTTVAAVKPYFEKFLKRWPTVADLAAAKSEEVMAAWAGLGYYARARNLHKCAQVVAREHAGVFPSTEEALLKLPGIGPYTAAAIASIAFGQRAVVVDGNVERVMARLHAVQETLPGIKSRLKELADVLTPHERAGDYAQAAMDLGATICTPKSPACVLCPWTDACAARKQGIAHELPRKDAVKDIPTRHGVIFWITDVDHKVLLIRRPPKGLLGGMLAFPTTEWRNAAWTQTDVAPPIKTTWNILPGVVEHTFTHFHLELEVWTGRLPRNANVADAIWTPETDVADAGLPNVMQKVVRHVAKASLVKGRALKHKKPVRARR
jgi:A/G-specific adenine glycosylase